MFFPLLLLAFASSLMPFSFALATPRLASRELSRVQRAQFLTVHNTERSSHGANPVQWSTDLEQKAESWASQCQFRGTEGSLSDTQYGENIVAATGDFSINDAVRTFLSDKDEYSPENPVYNHWTQVVWKSTTEIGCSISSCDGIFGPEYGTATLVVCLYGPAGNVVGEAPDNVEP